ncbi:MAG TPA: hypothetical protein VFF69_13220 [Phycisphaerales bacterium]|nr:hypothetical protein [Phycisphaerales bacterium]
MRRSPTGRVLCVVASALTLWASGGGAVAQPADEASPEQMLKDFIHYVLIARYDAADLVGQQLLSMDLPPQAFTDLLDTSGEYGRFRSAVGEAMRADVGGELESTAAALERLYESGRLERARSPEEITRNIGLLTGHLQSRYLATQRLLTAGEYAGPQLIEAFLDGQSPELQAVVQNILIEMGSQSVMPLCVALMNVTGPQQELVANVLGLKGYRTALPFLADVAESTQESFVREACQRAIDRLGGAEGASVADLYLQLGEVYYAERPEVTSFPGEDYQLVWSYLAEAPGTSLVMTPILTQVYHEAMAMRMAEATLREDSQNLDGAALWVASNIKRSVEQPDDYENPAYGADRREPMYFAVAAGTAVDHRVLARALDTRNTPLARRTIAAIEEIAGGAQLWSGTSDRRPLVEALGYPNRRVQYEAALAFGAAQPSSPFEGSDRVVPLLASAVRDASAQYAMVLTEDVEQYQALRRVLEGAGYQVLPRASGLAELGQEIADVAGVDVIVSALPRDAALALIDEARYSAKLAATPILALLDPQDAATLSPRFEREPMVMVRRAGIPEDALTNAVAQLVGNASGGAIAPEEARSYSERAITVLRDLAVSGNQVLQVQDATGPLVGALGNAEGGRRMAIAEVLAFIPDPRAQQALADVALASAGGEQAALLAKVADSAKRFGNQLDERQVAGVVAVATSDAPEESLAAAALLGALGVPNSDFLPQLLGE